VSRAGTVLVTGAAGFIGSTLVDRLLEEGREVVGFDNFDPFYPEREKRSNLAVASKSKRFRLVEGDVRDAERVGRLAADVRFDCVVHLAALAGVRPSLERPSAYADVNVNGSSVLFEAAVRSAVPRVVFASSSSVYGERASGAFRETDPVDRPISPYAATKKAAELVAHAFHSAWSLDVTCVRFFTAYGPRQRPDLAIRRFAERMLRGEPIPIYGDGTAVRDFTYVDDVVDGLVRAIDASLGYAILNFGAGRAVTVREMVEQLELRLGVEAKREYQPPQRGDVSHTLADLGAARAALGYEPRVRFEEGIERFVAWLARHREPAE
jgi:UDP-glucuronate 4-epimerase